jgi:hypothetical protein
MWKVQNPVFMKKMAGPTSKVPLLGHSIEYVKIRGITYILNSPVFWDIILYSPVRVNRRFRGTHCLHLQGKRVSEGRKEAATFHIIISI